MATEILTTCGGEVLRTQTSPYGQDYTVDLMTHPMLTRLPLETRLRILDGHPRRRGTTVTEGGAIGWTPEQFLEGLGGNVELSDALTACLTEKNFLSQAFGVTDYKAAKVRLSIHRHNQLERIRAKLAAEGIVV